MFQEALLNLLQQARVSGLPNLLVEDFDFDGAVVAGRVHRLAQTPQFNDASPIMARPIRIPGRGTGQSET